jgi:site-specific recombinase XerD
MADPRQPHPWAHRQLERYADRRTGWSDQHRQNMKSCLNRFADWLREHHGVTVVDATDDHCAAFMAERVKAVSGATARKNFDALNGFYTWAVRMDVLTKEYPRSHEAGPMHGVDRPTDSEPDPERIRRVTDSDYKILMRQFRRRVLIDARDAAICSMLYRSGPRRSEIARMDLERLVLDGDGPHILVLGKNKKWRRIDLLNETVEWLDRYLALRVDDTSPALFTSRYDGVEGRLQPDAISSMLDRRCARAGIAVSAHMFRRASTVEDYRNGVDPLMIQRSKGWSGTTAELMFSRYTSSEADQLAAEAIHAADPTKPPARASRMKSRLRAVK